jgi:hypothetical protein
MERSAIREKYIRLREWPRISLRYIRATISTLDAFHQRNIALVRDGDRFALRDATKAAAPS